jgi:hypothetical protein
MKRTLTLLVVFGTVGSVAFVARAEAGDDPVCSNATLQGTYGFREQGTIFTQGLIGGVGIVTFDGNGSYAVSGSFVNQTLGAHHRTGTGTYAVNPDCTGSIFPDTGGTHDFVVVDDGNEYFQIPMEAVPGQAGDRVVIWVLKRLFPKRHVADDNRR